MADRDAPRPEGPRGVRLAERARLQGRADGRCGNPRSGRRPGRAGARARDERRPRGMGLDPRGCAAQDDLRLHRRGRPARLSGLPLRMAECGQAHLLRQDLSPAPARCRETRRLGLEPQGRAAWALSPGRAARGPGRGRGDLPARGREGRRDAHAARRPRRQRTRAGRSTGAPSTRPCSRAPTLCS